jgi:hypothetical protein
VFFKKVLPLQAQNYTLLAKKTKKKGEKESEKHK